MLAENQKLRAALENAQREANELRTRVRELLERSNEQDAERRTISDTLRRNLKRLKPSKK